MKKNNKKVYSAPKISDIGDAKSIIKAVFVLGSGDAQPGMQDTLASS